jgi:hypothetical protein
MLRKVVCGWRVGNFDISKPGLRNEDRTHPAVDSEIAVAIGLIGSGIPNTSCRILVIHRCIERDSAGG